MADRVFGLLLALLLSTATIAVEPTPAPMLLPYPAPESATRHYLFLALIRRSEFSLLPTPTRPTLPPGDGPVTADTPLFGPPRARVEQMVAEIRSRANGEYTEYDVQRIVEQYDRVCRSVGIDPTLAVAQMLHETGYMTSFWAGRPRRNPAGIGVTGLTRSSPPSDPSNWAYDPASGMWRYGVSFLSWNDSVRAQVGRLLAYTLTDTNASAAQRELITESLRWRSLPWQLRGSAASLKQLGATHNPTGSGWANPGDNYGEAIARIAERIRAR